MKLKKKGQMHLTETIAVLFIFFILILFGLIFYYNYSAIAFKQQEQEFLSRKAIDVTTKTLFLPELICSRGEAESEDFCIDKMKLKHVRKTMEDHLSEYYFDLFKFANITVYEMSPDKRKWTIYEKVKPDFKDANPTYFVVTLRDDEKLQAGQSAYGFGYVKVVVYS